MILEQPKINQQVMKRSAFTITELMISTVITLLVMAALTESFKRLSDIITEGRGTLTLSDRLRGINAIIRQDLEGATVNPTSAYLDSQGVGYFEYYDGAASDYTGAVYGYVSTATKISEQFPLGRFSDFDDILMFTAKAKKEPFQGKVPLALMKAKDGRFDEIVPADWLPENRVAITSDYAEIVYFMAPTLSEEAVVASTPFDSGTGVVNFKSGPVAGFPSGFSLYRRVLLIRPDFNIMPVWATAPFGVPLTDESCLFHMTNQGAAFPNQVVSFNEIPLHAMTGNALAFQHCDLSMRRIPDAVLTNPAAMAANSLEDLMLRENRFAHWTVPGGSTLASSEAIPLAASHSTMPIIALTPPFALQSTAVNFALPTASGLLRSEFILWGERTGEDILMSNCVGLDIRIFDPNVPLYFHRSTDHFSGDGKKAVALQILGDSGSDDLVLSPSDPGYVEGIYPTTLGDPNDGSKIPEITDPAFDVSAQLNFAGRGAFVDIGWAAKTWKVCIDKAAYRGVTTFGGGTGKWDKTFSGFNTPPFSSPMTHGAKNSIPSWYLAGLVVANVSSSYVYVYQPTYDTGYSRYESDGRRQQKRSGAIDGTFWFNGNYQRGFTTTAAADPGIPVIDASIDGLDNATPEATSGNGFVDDDFEKETSPPFLEVLSAIEIRVRAEDKGTGAVQQSIITTDFRSR